MVENLPQVFDIIDVEAIELEYPDGLFVAMIHEDSFDEDMFEFLYGNDNFKGWIQLMIGESCKGSYVSDGQIVFVSPVGEVRWTQESIVKLAEDITLLPLPSVNAEISEMLRMIA